MLFISLDSTLTFRTKQNTKPYHNNEAVQVCCQQMIRSLLGAIYFRIIHPCIQNAFLLSLSNIVPPPSPFLFPFSLLILVVFTYLPTRLHAALTDDGHPHIFNHHPTMYYQPPPLAHCNGFAPATTRLEPIHAELRGRKKQKK